MSIIKKALERGMEDPIKGAKVLLCFPIIVLIRLISPFILIRFGSLNSIRMGHYFFDIEFYLNQKRVSKINSIDIFYISRNPAVNLFVEQFARRYININKIAMYLDYCNMIIPGGSKHKIIMATHINGSRDSEGLFSGTDPILTFSDEENSMGLKYLRSIGIENQNEYVCLLVRDSNYFKVILPEADMSKHDYRDSQISNYLLATEWLFKNKNIKTLRMGKFVKDRAPSNQYLIDYANSSDRSDFLDIWLMANCLFCISTTPGLETVSVCFRKPLLLSSHLPYGDARTGSDKCIELFKYIKSTKTGEYIGIREQIEKNLINAFDSNDYSEYEIIDNSKEEIKEATIELMKLIENKKIYSDETLKLNAKFWQQLKKWDEYNKYHGHINSFISPAFLKKNYDWLLD